MQGADPPLPEDLDDALDRLVDGPSAGFWPGVEALCARQPRWAARLRTEARARAAGDGSQHAPTSPPRGRQPLPQLDPAAVPTQIGPYRIFERIGEGGMGEVFKAERRTPSRQIVAIKVIKQGMATKEVLARFRLEQRALAAMNHRCVARVFDAGATERGEPYFVMEYIEGVPLTEYCDKHKLSLAERIALFQQVCGGVQHAHQKGFVHRDLKPGNVLVARDGDEPLAKVLDFGLAKAMNRDVVDITYFTERERVMGTYEYMAPEQAAGAGEAIDARTDIYALGVILYEMLAGELPFPDLRTAPDMEKIRRICEEVPGKPSTRLAGKSEHATQVAAKRRALRGGLDWVVLKALAKEPERRYASAAALAADLARFLAHEPLEAGPPSFGYRARVFARRYRLQLGTLGAVTATVLVALVSVATFWRRAEAKAIEAEDARRGEATKTADAEQSARLLTAKVREFDQLAGAVLYEQVVESQRALHPAWPAQVAGLERWLDDAARLLAMRAELEQTLTDLRTRALPPTAAEQEQDRRGHPQFAAWQQRTARLASLTRAHAIRTGAEVLVLPSLGADEQAMAPAQLYPEAWPLVTPEENKRVWGQEPLGCKARESSRGARILGAVGPFAALAGLEAQRHCPSRPAMPARA